MMRKYLIYISLILSFLNLVAASAEEPLCPMDEDVCTIEGITLAIHRWASVEKDGVRDKFLLKKLVTADAYAVNFRKGEERRTSHMVNLIERFGEEGPVQVGYIETVTDMRIEQTDHAANVWASYEIRGTKDGPVTMTGITNLQLYHDGRRWWILGWVNIITSGDTQ